MDEADAASKGERGVQVPISTRVQGNDVVLVAEVRPTAIKQLLTGTGGELAARDQFRKKP